MKKVVKFGGSSLASAEQFKKVGNIIDIAIENNGRMTSFIVEKSKFFVSMFSNKNELEIKWEQIEKIGEDVILVTIKL